LRATALYLRLGESGPTEGNKVLRRRNRSSTHATPVEGPAGTIATTGRRITGSGVQIGRYERRHATLIRVCYDRVDVLGQPLPN